MRHGFSLLAVLACATLCVACGSHHARSSRPSTTSQISPPPQTLKPTPASVPTHVQTWAYVDSCHGVGPGQTSLVRQWVTFAETKCATDHGLAPADCHANSVSYCTSISYIDPNLDWSRAGLGMVIPSCTAATSGQSTCGNEDWFVHKAGYHDRDHRLTWTNADLGLAYLLNGADSSLDRFIVGYAHRVLSGFDGLMVDDVGSGQPAQFYGDANPIYTTSEELRSDDAVQQSHADLAAKLASSFTQIDNGLVVNPNVLPAFGLLNRPAAVVGLVSESYPENGGTNTLASWYSSGLDDMAYLDDTVSLSRDFLVLLGYNPDGDPVARRVQEATVMLGFSPGKIVDWADLAENRPGLAVWPEEGLYFTRPVQTMQAPTGSACMNGLGGPCDHGHADLEVASGTNAHEQTGGAGVYRREFRSCFLQGVPVGGCATIMNDTDHRVVVSKAWLALPYRYEMKMNGGEISSGGRLDVRGTPFKPGETTIGADDAALLSQ
jgi:hypothetical protein